MIVNMLIFYWDRRQWIQNITYYKSLKSINFATPFNFISLIMNVLNECEILKQLELTNRG